MTTPITPELDLRALRDDARGLLERVVAKPGMSPGSKAYRAYQLEVDRYVSDATNGQYRNLAALNKAMAAPAVRGAARSVVRGATFNFDDELARALNVGTAPGGMYSPEGEAEFQQFRRDNKWTSLAGEVLGGMALPVGAVMRGARSVRGVIGRAAGVGATTAGLAAAGDATGDVGERAGQAVLPALTGGVAGGLIPGLVIGGQVANRVRQAGVPEFAARFNMARDVANAGDIGVNGLPRPNVRAPISQLPTRVAAGSRRLAEIADRQALAGRSGITVVADLDDGLGARTINAVRGNPTLAASENARMIANRSADAPARAAGDVQAALAAEGRPLTLPSLADAQQGRPTALAGAVAENFGAVPPVPAPVLGGAPTVGASTLNAADRIEELRRSRAAWAASATGFDGLRAATSRGVAPLGNQLDPVLRRLNVLVERNPSRPTTRLLNEVAEGVTLLRTGNNVGRIGVDEARGVLNRITDILDSGYMPVEGGGRIDLTSGEINALQAARERITAGMDARIAAVLWRGALPSTTGGRAASTTPFSDATREYARRSAQIRAVETGRNLANNRIDDLPNAPSSPNATDLRQAFERIPAEHREDARLGFASELISRLRAEAPNTTGGIVQKIVRFADSEWTERVQLAFPSKAEFRRVLFQAEAMKAMDDGAEYMARHTPDQLRAFMEQLAVSARTPGGKVDKGMRNRIVRNFQDGMLSRFLDDLSEPDKTANIAEILSGPNSDLLAKAEVMLGKRGVATLRQRLDAENRVLRNSRFMADAARNPAARDPGIASQLVSRNNPGTLLTNVTAIGRRALAPGLAQRYQAEMLRLGSMGASPQSLSQFTNLMQQTTAGVNPNTLATRLGPAMLGRGIAFGANPPE